MSEFWMKLTAMSSAAAGSTPERCLTATPTSCPPEQQSMPASAALHEQPQPLQLPKQFLPGAAQMGLGIGMGLGMPMGLGVGVLGGPGAGLHHPPLGLCKPKKMRKPRTSMPPVTTHRLGL